MWNIKYINCFVEKWLHFKLNKSNSKYYNMLIFFISNVIINILTFFYLTYMYKVKKHNIIIIEYVNKDLKNSNKYKFYFR